MKAKIVDGKYENIAALQADFSLVIGNCKTVSESQPAPVLSDLSWRARLSRPRGLFFADNLLGRADGRRAAVLSALVMPFADCGSFILQQLFAHQFAGARFILVLTNLSSADCWQYNKGAGDGDIFVKAAESLEEWATEVRNRPFLV